VVFSSTEWAGFAERVHALDQGTREALADRWSAAALGEHASVGSFAQFTLQLLAVGAPPELLVASHRAGLEEIEHARLSFRIASAFAGAAFGPGPLPLPGGMPEVSLVAAARATLIEGCIAETMSADEALHAASSTTDPTIGAVLRRISEDEARHAELAYTFVGWAIQSGGMQVRDALRVTAREHLAAHERLAAPEAASIDLRPWGILSARQRFELQRQTIRTTVHPAVQSMLG
jgi:hypothetical protein